MNLEKFRRLRFEEVSKHGTEPKIAIMHFDDIYQLQHEVGIRNFASDEQRIDGIELFTNQAALEGVIKFYFESTVWHGEVVN